MNIIIQIAGMAVIGIYFISLAKEEGAGEVEKAIILMISYVLVVISYLIFTKKNERILNELVKNPNIKKMLLLIFGK